VSHDRHIPTLAEDRIDLGGLSSRWVRVGGTLAVVGLLLAVLLGAGRGDHFRRFAFSYLLNFSFFLSLSLGALFFVKIQHVTRASWSVVARRLGEAMGALMPLMAVLFVPILFLAPKIFPWVSGAPELPAELLEHKAPYLNMPFFIARWALYFLVWSWLGVGLWRRSIAQDRSGDPSLTLKMERSSALGLVLYAFTVNFAAYDLLMSLDPAWYSTMFGPYYFAGSVVVFFAALSLVTFWLQSRGRMAKVITVEHLHDYGKLLFAFVFFWAYLAFSQYMLIWYGNIPEETVWYLRRQQEGWQWVGLTLVFGHFLLPFAGLVSRYAKRSRPMLLFWAAWVFVMHWVDLFWLVMPEFDPSFSMQAMDVACFVGMGGIYLAAFATVLARASLVPTGDPRLDESLAFENA